MSDPYTTPTRPTATVDIRDAVEQQGLSVDDLARTLGVDTSKVESWVQGRTDPPRRVRTAIAKLVEVPTRKLWPDLVDHSDISTQAEFDKLIGIPQETWAELLGMATRHIDMLGGGYGWWLEQNPQFNQLARAKEQDTGLKVRICQADPNGDAVRQRDELEAQRTSLTAGNLIGGIETAASMWKAALQGLDNAELRGSEHAYELLLMRFDDYLIVCPYLHGMRGTLTYAELVHRDDHGGKFDHIIQGHFQPIWETAKPI